MICKPQGNLKALCFADLRGAIKLAASSLLARVESPRAAFSLHECD
jgi:hypothetical protein